MKTCSEMWAGDFGNEYTRRNDGDDLFSAKVLFFYRALSRVHVEIARDDATIIEFGANRGMNLDALNMMDIGYSNMTAVEINTEACCHIHSGVTIINDDMLSCREFGQHDLVLAMGLLIHIPPEKIHAAYNVLASASSGYILIAEYFAATETEVPYRGNNGMLWRRNYGKDFLALHPEFVLHSYGFVADIDPIAPLDNINYWLMERVR